MFFADFKSGKGNNEIRDSLLAALSETSSKTERLDLVNELSNYYKNIDLDSCEFFASQTLAMAEEQKNESFMAAGYNQLGNVQNARGFPDIALDYFIEALKHAEMGNDQGRLAKINNNIGIVHYISGDLDQSLKYFKKSANLLIGLGDTLGAVFAFNNTGGIYISQKKHVEALAYFQRGYKLSLALGDIHAESVLLSGIGSTHAEAGDYDEAKAPLYRALELKNELGNKNSATHTLMALGDVYIAQKNLDSAKYFYSELLAVAQELELAEEQKKAYKALSDIHEQKGNDSKSLFFLKTYETIKDSLENQEKQSTISEIQAKYDKAQDQKTIEHLENIRLQHLADDEHSNLIRSILIFGGLIVIILSVVIYSRLRNSRKQTRDLGIQKALVDEKNREVTDSINYAKRIQTAMLKSEERQSGNRFDNFVLFKPKDIVSGDFYWVEEEKDFVLLAAIDCTGHGVPGAFLTLLGTAFLNEIILKDEKLSPAQILNKLREKIIKELSQGEEGGSKDGMDMSLIKLYNDGRKAEWAGANNPLWIYRTGLNEIEEIKADKEHIGYSYSMTDFTNHEVELSAGDAVYLFSDGFADQFGGLQKGAEKEKKFKSRQMREMIVEHSDLDMTAQKNAFERVFEEWKGDIDQLDDVCMIGIISVTKFVR